jgi:hypothetical protein
MSVTIGAQLRLAMDFRYPKDVIALDQGLHGAFQNTTDGLRPPH